MGFFSPKDEKPVRPQAAFTSTPHRATLSGSSSLKFFWDLKSLVLERPKNLRLDGLLFAKGRKAGSAASGLHFNPTQSHIEWLLKSQIFLGLEKFGAGKTKKFET